MAKVIKLNQLGTELKRLVNEAADKEVNALERAYRGTLIAVLGQVMIDTPVDKGMLRGSWMLEETYNPSKRGKAKKNKGQNYIRNQLSSRIVGKKRFFYNNQPYASVVEYGGYPDPVKVGSLNESGKYEKKSRRGFSRQAPAGMLRVNLNRFDSILRRQWRAQRGRIR